MVVNSDSSADAVPLSDGDQKNSDGQDYFTLTQRPNTPSFTSYSGANSSLPERKRSVGGRNLKVVYRILRQISDWALAGFFAETCVDGAENVCGDGALILTPCHHNEIIDIATLSATIPHRRIIAYWTKASLFHSLISRFILRSAGAIPVARAGGSKQANASSHIIARNGDSSRAADSASKSMHNPNDRQALFEATYKELAKEGGGVLAAFPEGTSYTMPHIMQVKEGAARAALGYVRWLRDHVFLNVGQRHAGIPISLVPVGIVYTDKSRYRSRLYVQYGSPIDLSPFIDCSFPESEASDDEDNVTFRSAVCDLTKQIEKRMKAATVNARDWDILFAARTARSILWPDEQQLRLQHFLKISKILIDIFENPSLDTLELRTSLTRYHALLYCTALTHTSLAHVPFPPSIRHPSKSAHCLEEQSRLWILDYPGIGKLLMRLPTFVFPLLLSVPAHLSHSLAYAFAALASRILAGEDEEARAQYKVVFGGLGRIIGTLATARALLQSKLVRSSVLLTTTSAANFCVHGSSRVLQTICEVMPSSWNVVVGRWGQEVLPFAFNFVRSCWSRFGGARRTVGILGIVWILCAWHSYVIDANYIRYKRARATLTVLRAVLSSRHVEGFDNEEMKPYLVTPRPPINPFIAKHLQSTSEDSNNEAGGDAKSGGKEKDEVPNSKKDGTRVSKSMLVRYVLLARADAVTRLRATFSKLERQRIDDSNGVVVDGTAADLIHGDLYVVEHRKMLEPADFQTLRECGAVF